MAKGEKRLMRKIPTPHTIVRGFEISLLNDCNPQRCKSAIVLAMLEYNPIYEKLAFHACLHVIISSEIT